MPRSFRTYGRGTITGSEAHSKNLLDPCLSQAVLYSFKRIFLYFTFEPQFFFDTFVIEGRCEVPQSCGV